MDGVWEPVGSYYYNRVMLIFRANPDALQSRLPHPWTVHDFPDGANIVIGFCEVLLHLDAAEQPVPTAQYYYSPINGRAFNPDNGENANMRYATLSDRLEDRSKPLTIVTNASHEKRIDGDGREVFVKERFEFSSEGDSELSLNLEYRRAVPQSTGRIGSENSHQMFVRYPSGSSELYLYRNEELHDVLFSVDGGIDRLQSLEYRISNPVLKEIFDGTEDLRRVTSVPISKREVLQHRGSGSPRDATS